MLSGCQWFEQKRMTGVAVALNGQYLYQSTLDSLSFGLLSEDSARVVEQYVKQWAKDILVYDKAKGAVDKTIEAFTLYWWKAVRRYTNISWRAVYGTRYMWK